MNTRKQLPFQLLKTALFCPVCDCSIVQYKQGYGCTNNRCTFFIPKEIRQRLLNEDIIRDLLEKGTSKVLHGFYKKGNNQTFSAQLILTKNNTVKIELPTLPFLQCPKCQASLICFENGYSCSREGACGFVLWNRFGGKSLTNDQMIQLISKKKTGMIHGFISKKNGKKYSARIVLNKNSEPRVVFI